MAENKHVLVTGATGQQGGAVARALLETGHRVRGLTRNPTSGAAQTLASLGAEMVAGDFADPASLRAATDGVDAIFGMGTPFEVGMEAEVAHGIALVDAAVAAEVDQFVYTSVASADAGTGIPHFDSKYEVEKYLAASDLTWTVIAPVYFMENLFFPQTLEGLRNGVYAIAMPSNIPLQQVALADIGAFGAHVIGDPETFCRERIELASDEVTAVQTAEILSSILDRSIAPIQVPMDQIRAFSEDLALMFEWFIDTGYSVDIEGLRAAYPSVGWHRFDDWAAQRASAIGTDSAS